MTSQRKPSAVEVASQSTKAGASASVFAQFLQRSRELAPDELVLFAEAGFARELKTFADQFAINMMHIPKMSLGGLGNQYHFKRSLLFPCFSTLCWANGLNFLSSGDRAVRSGVRLSDGSISTWTSSPNSVAYPEAPSGLLMMLRRPGRQSLCGVQVSNTILGVILDQMDFQHFDEVSICSLAVSSVHATHGSGRQIFVERISADQKFSMFRYRLLRLWDETEREIHYGNYRWDSYKDLNRLLSEHGSALRIGRSKVGIDAELVDVSRGVDRVVAVSPEQFLTVGATLGTIEDGVEEGNWKGVSGKSVSALTDLSGQFCTVLDGDLRVMYLEENDEIKGRRCWKSVSPRAFSDHFSNRRIECEGRKTMPLGKAWLEWPKRPSAIGLTFDASKSPTSSIESRIVNGRLNLWSGFGCIPQEKIGGWSCLAAMIRDDLCGGNEEYYQYVLRWIAFKIQNPGLPCETSLVFKGPKGVGKTTLGEIMIEIFGSHGLVVSRRSQFAGQFSGHLATACFVFADEAVWGGNKEDEGTLKKLITDRHVLYRAMYKEETYGVNRVGLMMATNEDWAVPATFEERRFVVLEGEQSPSGKQPWIDNAGKSRAGTILGHRPPRDSRGRSRGFYVRHAQPAARGLEPAHRSAKNRCLGGPNRTRFARDSTVVFRNAYRGATTGRPWGRCPMG